MNCIFSSCTDLPVSHGMCNDHTMLIQRIAHDVWPGLTSIDGMMASLGGNSVQLLMDTIVGRPDATLDDVTAALAAWASGVDPAALEAAVQAAVAAGLAASGGASPTQLQPLLDALSARPDSGAGTVEQVVAVMQAASDANTALYLLINTLAGKPGGGGTVADVEVALPAAMQAIVDAATAPLEARIASLESTMAAVLKAFNPPSATGNPSHIERFVNGVTDTIVRIDTDIAALRDGIGAVLAQKADVADLATVTQAANGYADGRIQLVFGVLDDSKADKADVAALDNRVTAIEAGAPAGSGGVDLTPVLNRIAAVETGKADKGDVDLLELQTTGAIEQLANEKAEKADVEPLLGYIQRIADLLAGDKTIGSTTLEQMVTGFKALLDAKADKTQLGVNAQGQVLATKMELDTGLGTKADKNGVAQFMEQQTAQWGNLATHLAQNVPTKDEVTEVDGKAEALAVDVQGIFDVFAEQTGGSLRQLQDFYTNLTAWIAGATATDADLAQFIVDLNDQTVGTVTSWFDQIVEELVRIDGDATWCRSQIRLLGEDAGNPVGEFLNLLNEIVGKLIEATGITPRHTLGTGGEQ